MISAVPMRKPPGYAYQELVGTLAKAFAPDALAIDVGKWIKGPDGRLDMDVSIRGIIDGKEHHTVIECKDFDPLKRKKVGRSFVDALDSKRHDMKADSVFISSNSGFTDDALKKARRKNIGAISVLSLGDSRAKITINEEIYFRKVYLGPRTFAYSGVGAIELKGAGLNELQYKGAPVDAWLETRASAIVTYNPKISREFLATFAFKEPTKFNFRGNDIMLESISIRLSPTTQWYSQIVQVDVSLGMYDYFRRRVRSVGSEQKHILKGVNFDTGTLLRKPPKMERWGKNLLPGEMDLALVMIMDGTQKKEISLPPLEEVIIPEDLVIPDQELV